ncbi:MAG: uroporphyrinogen-III synthase [Deltaproteobacteria bacterium]|nr:uroporphyrinogen-III synthase [Deltaproteobacteria bacterium]
MTHGRQELLQVPPLHRPPRRQPSRRRLEARDLSALDRLRARLVDRRVDAIAFASPSAVKGFVASFAPGEAAPLLKRVCIAAMGPVTARAVVDLGMEVGVVPVESTGEALVDALVGHLGGGHAYRRS